VVIDQFVVAVSLLVVASHGWTWQLKAGCIASPQPDFHLSLHSPSYLQHSTPRTMWLLDTATLKLRYFITTIPDYVILSHTWGEDEVSFDDIAQPYAKDMAGYSKISRCCAQAVEAGFEWAWVDTCCIDKRSSAELSEAINSMYKWYWNAAICYAYISDCLIGDDKFTSSRWFKRGWTLQELLAPDVIEFFDSDWRFMGTKSGLLDEIHAATKIEKQYLLERNAINIATVAAKFSWASARTTTREEDMAYCLLGLVRVNMPMLYGEGSGAFYRLQLEMIKQTNEHTIFAWDSNEDGWHHASMFATSPVQFVSGAGLRTTLPRVQGKLGTHEITNHGLSITLPCISVDQNRVIAVLNCLESTGNHVGVWLERTGSGVYRRPPLPRTVVTVEDIQEATAESMHIEQFDHSPKQEAYCECSMGFDDPLGEVDVWRLARGHRLALLATHHLHTDGPDIRSFIIRENEFACLGIEFMTLSSETWARLFLFVGLHGGRPWIIHMSGLGELPGPWEIATEVEKTRKLFESQTNDQPAPLRYCHYVDSLTFHTETGHVLEVLARKKCAKEGLQWRLKVTVEPSPQNRCN